MVPQPEIAVRRARVSDSGPIAAFVNRALARPAVVDEQAVIERFGSVGFLLAERGDDLVGMLGWQAENLVVRVTDFLIWPASERVAVGRALLSEMERAATELQCETALLFLPRSSPPALIEFCQTLGYDPQVVADLPKVWQQAAREARMGDDETVWMRQLRAGPVVRPL
jgi:N-acetylglutamate synthase-like GNAT family acetyltransferase